MKKKDFKLVDHIVKGMKRSYDEMKDAPDRKERDGGYFDQFKIKLKKKKMPTALRAVYYKEKYAQFFGQDSGREGSSKDVAVPKDNAETAVEKAVGDGKGVTAVGGHKFDEVEVKEGAARWSAFAAPDGGDDEVMGDHVGDAYAGGPMASGFSFSGSEAGPGGFGLGDFGMVAFGEAVNRNMRAARAFIRKSGLPPKAAKVVEDGYRFVFQSIIEGETAVMFGIQPSMSDYIRFELDTLVHALNSYSGAIVSVVMSEASGMESIDDIRKWYVHLGVKPDVVSEIIFVEKANEVKYETMMDIDINAETSSEFVLRTWKSVRGFAAELSEPRLLGCADTYLMGEFMAALAESEVKFEIDRRFLFIL